MTVQSVTLSAPAVITPPADRPTWLPEKFKTPEEMASAYSELEKKQGTPAPAAPAAPVAPPAGFDSAQLAKEYNENGALLPETVAALTAKGFTSEMVTQYVAGLDAIQAQRATDIASVVGGTDKLKSIIEWAKTGLTPQEIAAYDSAIDSGNDAQAKLLLQAIQVKHLKATGKEPQLTQAESVPGASGIRPYGSTDEVYLDMRKKDYKENPAFRAQVTARLRVSKL